MITCRVPHYHTPPRPTPPPLFSSRLPLCAYYPRRPDAPSPQPHTAALAVLHHTLPDPLIHTLGGFTPNATRHPHLRTAKRSRILVCAAPHLLPPPHYPYLPTTCPAAQNMRWRAPTRYRGFVAAVGGNTSLLLHSPGAVWDGVNWRCRVRHSDVAGLSDMFTVYTCRRYILMHVGPPSCHAFIVDVRGEPVVYLWHTIHEHNKH